MSLQQEHVDIRRTFLPSFTPMHIEKNKIFIELSIHYGCRPIELRMAEIEHVNIDSGSWTIPRQNNKVSNKTRQPIVRPIIPEINELWKRVIEL